jgi:ABC-type lipoprotein export system ATPase subunit
MIKLKEISKYYENKFIKTYVLRNINLEIAEGEFVSIMGPSGAD